jgi:hypothetical protein
MLNPDPFVAGLNGYVVYPTQQLNSGLAPLSLIGNITGNARTICIKPGQYLLDSDASLIKDMLVSIIDAPMHGSAAGAVLSMLRTPYSPCRASTCPSCSDTIAIPSVQCDANGSAVTFAWWELRVSLPVYIMAVQSVLGKSQHLAVGAVAHSIYRCWHLRMHACDTWIRC